MKNYVIYAFEIFDKKSKNSEEIQIFWEKIENSQIFGKNEKINVLKEIKKFGKWFFDNRKSFLIAKLKIETIGGQGDRKFRKL